VSKEVLAIGLTLLVHIVGLVALIWALVLDPEDRPDWRDWWPGGDDDRPLDPSPAPRGAADRRGGERRASARAHSSERRLSATDP
jgi:hypothetical protein